MNPEIHARLTIHGEIDPQVVTDRLGVEPDWTVRKGESWYARNPDRIATNDVWSSKWSKGKPIVGASYLADLLATFWPKRDILQTLKQEFGVGLEVSVAIYIYDDGGICETPSLHLDRDLLQRITDLGAEIDIDLYVMAPPDEQDEPDEQ